MKQPKIYRIKNSKTDDIDPTMFILDDKYLSDPSGVYLQSDDFSLFILADENITTKVKALAWFKNIFNVKCFYVEVGTVADISN